MRVNVYISREIVEGSRTERRSSKPSTQRQRFCCEGGSGVVEVDGQETMETREAGVKEKEFSVWLDWVCV